MASALPDLAIDHDAPVAIELTVELYDAARFKNEIMPREYLASTLFPKDVALTPRVTCVKLLWEDCSALHPLYFELLSQRSSSAWASLHRRSSQIQISR